MYLWFRYCLEPNIYFVLYEVLLYSAWTMSMTHGEFTESCISLARIINTVHCVATQPYTSRWRSMHFFVFRNESVAERPWNTDTHRPHEIFSTWIMRLRTVNTRAQLNAMSNELMVIVRLITCLSFDLSYDRVWLANENRETPNDVSARYCCWCRCHSRY